MPPGLGFAATKAAPAVAKGIGVLGKGLIAGLGDIVSGLFGNRARKRESQRQREWTESMWERQNAYNTPAMQMKRLREAGLNPALMYGQGTTGNAEKALPYQQAQIQDVGANFAQSVAAGSAAALSNSQEKLNNANAAYSAILGATKAGELDLAKKVANYTIDNLTADTNKKEVEAANIAVDTSLKSVQVNFTKQQIAQSVATTQKILADTNLTKVIIEKDYGGQYGKNTFNNIDKALDNMGINSKSASEVLGAIAVVGVARNPAAIGKMAHSTSKWVNKNLPKVKKKYNQLVSYFKWKFGKKGWLNIK